MPSDKGLNRVREEPAYRLVCFDTSKEGTLGSNEIKDGLTTFGKSPSNKSVQRILKQIHLSQAPVNRVEFKGFALGIISRRSLLYDFLYDG